GCADGRAVARRLHRGRGRRGVRADAELLRRRGSEAAMSRLSIGPALAAVVVLAWLVPLAAQDTRLPPVFDGAAALRHVALLPAIRPPPAGAPPPGRARPRLVGG